MVNIKYGDENKYQDKKTDKELQPNFHIKNKKAVRQLRLLRSLNIILNCNVQRHSQYNITQKLMSIN
jgi:hypothetical protein